MNVTCFSYYPSNMFYASMMKNVRVNSESCILYITHPDQIKLSHVSVSMVSVTFVPLVLCICIFYCIFVLMAKLSESK